MSWAAAIGASIAANIAAVSEYHNRKKDREHNMEMAEYQAAANERYLDKQNEYNSPKNQMLRYQQAGLNPNLMYGQGSPGNQNQALTYPDPGRGNYHGEYGQIAMSLLPQINQARLADSQVNAQNASTRAKHASADLLALQKEVAAKNPLLNETGFNAIIDGLKASAELKSNQATGQNIQNWISDASAGHQVSEVYQRVQLLEQKFHLGQQDQKIKAEILKSNEFKNAILEVQKDFMTNNEFTPQHIYQFIQLLLMKLL